MKLSQNYYNSRCYKVTEGNFLKNYWSTSSQCWNFAIFFWALIGHNIIPTLSFQNSIGHFVENNDMNAFWKFHSIILSGSEDIDSNVSKNGSWEKCIKFSFILKDLFFKSMSLRCRRAKLTLNYNSSKSAQSTKGQF